MIPQQPNSSAFVPQSDLTSAPSADRAIYGFILYLLSKSFFVFYLLWAFIPNAWFCDFGIDFLPDRYWAISIPIFFLTCLAIFVFVIYPSCNLCLTPHFSDPRLVPQTPKVSDTYITARTLKKILKTCYFSIGTHIHRKPRSRTQTRFRLSNS